jgi:LysM repeat protein
MKRFLLLLGLGLILVLGPVQVFAAPAAQGSTYTVQPGDSLWRIATQFGTTPSAIQQANNLKSTTIYIGQVLVIPGANIPATAQPGPTYRGGCHRWLRQPHRWSERHPVEHLAPLRHHSGGYSTSQQHE